jgi:hypothetical protein
MGQARNRRVEIENLKKQGKRVETTIDGFRPDAGMNSNEGTNHYWFQVTELIMTLSQNDKLRSYESLGQRWIEINVPVDIMDQAGEIHTRPRLEDGYFATFRFTADLLDEFADQIDRGAMSVRITGVPKERQSAPSGERFRVIEVADSWSAGNDCGHMMYMVMSRRGPVQTSSKEMARGIRSIAQEMRADEVMA